MKELIIIKTWSIPYQLPHLQYWKSLKVNKKDEFHVSFTLRLDISALLILQLTWLASTKASKVVASRHPTDNSSIDQYKESIYSESQALQSRKTEIFAF